MRRFPLRVLAGRTARAERVVTGASASLAISATFVVLAILAGFGAASATEWSVRVDGTGDFPTIQAAVDGAVAGDEIVLEDGTFTGDGNRDIRFDGKDLIVRSRGGAGACTIDSQGSVVEHHRAFRLDAGETQASRIEGITITGGFVEGVFPESGGGGILVAYGSHPVITDCVFDANEAGFEGFGAGLLAWTDCDITLTDCTFVNGVSGWYGGGFTLRYLCDATVERCVVVGNFALHAGGGASITRSNPTVTDCLFADNEVTEVDGGGVLVKAEAEPLFTRCVFSGNRSWAGGGLGLGNLPIVTLVDCLFEGNTAYNRGGAIELDQEPSTIHIFNCTFAGNQAGYYGGHVYTGPFATTTIRNSAFGHYCGAPTSLYVSYDGVLDIDCSVLPGGEGEVIALGSLTWGSDMVDADPAFCAPIDSCSAASWPAGDYGLDSMSPASPSWHPCGRVGAYPVTCGATSVGESVRDETWGRLKAMYRSSGTARAGGPAAGNGLE